MKVEQQGLELEILRELASQVVTEPTALPAGPAQTVCVCYLQAPINLHVVKTYGQMAGWASSQGLRQHTDDAREKGTTSECPALPSDQSWSGSS